MKIWGFGSRNEAKTAKGKLSLPPRNVLSNVNHSKSNNLLRRRLRMTRRVQSIVLILLAGLLFLGAYFI